jgi:RimJ/RimL family protein N-acetyltransferase
MMKNDVIIKLKEVTKPDCRFLYDLLKQRDPRSNISHKKMPTYQDHVKFVLSKPYSKWYVIYYKNKKSGSVYLSKQNEIGIFLKKGMAGKGIATEAVKQLMKNNPRKRYLANVNPHNIKSIKFFKKFGFNLIQYTFELMDDGM